MSNDLHTIINDTINEINRLASLPVEPPAMINGRMRVGRITYHQNVMYEWVIDGMVHDYPTFTKEQIIGCIQQCYPSIRIRYS